MSAEGPHRAVSFRFCSVSWPGRWGHRTLASEVLHLTVLSVAPLPLAPAAERRYVCTGER